MSAGGRTFSVRTYQGAVSVNADPLKTKTGTSMGFPIAVITDFASEPEAVATLIVNALNEYTDGEA